MAYTREDLNTLKSAMASGKKRMRLNNREVEYQSVSQMAEAMAIIEAEVIASEEAAGLRPRKRRGFRGVTSKGL